MYPTYLVIGEEGIGKCIVVISITFCIHASAIKHGERKSALNGQHLK